MDIEDVINEVNHLDSDDSISSEESRTSRSSKLLKYSVNLEKREFKDAEVQCYLDKELIIPLDIYNLKNSVFLFDSFLKASGHWKKS